MNWPYSEHALTRCTLEQLQELFREAEERYKRLFTEQESFGIKRAELFQAKLEMDNAGKELARRIPQSSVVTNQDNEIIENRQSAASSAEINGIQKGRRRFLLNSSDWLSLAALIVSICFGWYNWQQNDKQFKLINKPRLQIINVGFTERSFNSLPLSVNFQLENLGNFPAEITHGKFGWVLAGPFDQEPWNRGEHARYTTLQKFSVTKERPYSQRVELTQLDSSHLFTLRNLANPFYIVGEYYYYDQVSEKEMVYKMAIQVRKDGTFSPQVAINEEVSK